MRMLARFHKDKEIIEISHLDTMRAIQRALRRADIPVCYSQGFHPHINLAFASALGVGLCSEAEWMDVELAHEMSAEDFKTAMMEQMPTGMSLEESHSVEDRYPALMSVTAWADYRIELVWNQEINLDMLVHKTKEYIQKPIFVMKKSKKGMQEVDIQPLIEAFDFEEINDQQAKIYMRCIHATSGALNPLLFLSAWMKAMEIGVTCQCDVTRTNMWAQQDEKPIPIYDASRKGETKNSE